MRRKGWLLLFIGLLVFTSLIMTVSAENLKVMTYNVRYGCGSNEACANYGETLTALKAVIDQQQPDIFGIQEGNNDGRVKKEDDKRNPFVALQEELKDTYFSKGYKVGIFVKKTFGNLDSAKINTYSSDVGVLPTGAERAYIRAEVTTAGGQKIIVYNTHLYPVPLKESAQKTNLKACVEQQNGQKASVNLNKEEQDFSNTEREAKELAEIVSKETLPVIVMGDMNAESDHLSPLKSALSEIELLSDHKKTFPIKPYCAETARYGYQDWFQDLDHIFYNGFTASYGTVVTTSPADTASDHYPVVASLTIDPSRIKQDPCGNKKIAIMGASNDVEPSYANYLRGTCPGSEIKVFAEESLTITQQKGKYIDTNEIKNFKPNILIINPSGNSCGDENEINAGITSLTDINKGAWTWEPSPVIALLTISPRHQTVNGKIEQLSYQSCVESFNNRISSLEKNKDQVLSVIDLNRVLGGAEGYSCKYCFKEGNNDQYIHWTDAGDKEVAKAILKTIFGTEVEPVKGGQGSKSSPPSGVAPQPGQQTAATVQIEQGCAINQRCKDIDTAWNVFGGVLGLHSGQVWVPLKNTWMTFNDAYGAKTVIGTQAPPTKSSGITLSGGVQCDAHYGTNEQKALLDAIAWGESTGCVTKKGQSSAYRSVISCAFEIQDMSQHPYYPENNKASEMGKFVSGTSSDFAKKYQSSAAGRYQFMPGTYSKLKEKGFFSSFNEVEQDKAGLQLLKDHRVNVDLINSAISDEIWDAAAKEWAAISYSKPITSGDWCNQKNKDGKPHIADPSKCGNGQSYYGQGGISHASLNAAFNKCLEYYQKGGIGEKILDTGTTDTPSEPTPSSPAGPPADQTPTTPSTLKIIVVGDSHIAYGTSVNPFGRELSRLLRTTGAQVQSYGSGGSTAYPWMENKAWIATPYEIDEQGKEIKLSENKLFSQLKSDFSPNVVIIVLGTNNVDQPESTYQSRIDASKKMAEAAVTNGATCYWVGPPQRKDNVADKVKKTFLDIFSAVNSNCKFINSIPLTEGLQMSDNFHYTSAGGKEWAQKVFVEIEDDQVKIDNKCFSTYPLNIGDGYRHRCIDATHAQACAPLTGVQLPQYSIDQITDTNQKAQLESTCTSQFTNLPTVTT